MKTRKLCGYDVNGWRDCVARNWIARPGNDEEIGPLHIVKGAALGDVVNTGEGKHARWIGGVQAQLAPHGRGGGWGLVGSADRRRSVRSLIHGQEMSVTCLAAAFTGLARGASHAVSAIDDSPNTTEAMQERLLDALSVAKAGKVLLVWRSVLAVLDAIESGLLGGHAREGTKVGVIGHVGEGFSVQTLRLRVETLRSGDIIAPERRKVGELVESRLGYAGLAETARNAIVAIAPEARSEHFGSARSIGQVALGLPADSEPLRRANGDWDILDPPPQLSHIDTPLEQKSLGTLEDCDVVLLESLAEGNVLEQVKLFLEKALRRPLVALPPNAVARGALVAAYRFSAGEPVYFDFLPKIATIVQGEQGAVTYELIDDRETLPAGRLYRSPAPARFALQSGQERFHVYIRKETQSHPRKAVVEVGTPVREPTPVDMWVEQMPAAGRAKILMQAPALARQFTVDWESAEDLETSWEDLLQKLEGPLPTVPKRLVLPCGIQGWEDGPEGPGLLSLLQENANADAPDWDALAKRLSARPIGRYCISSDGELPPQVPKDARSQLDGLTTRAFQDLTEIAVGQRRSQTGQLKFLTWQFRRCPPGVEDLLLDAWERRGRNNHHPFCTHALHWVLIHQGLGRIASKPTTEKRALHMLLDRPANGWNWREESAAAAFLLSRSDTAPLVLEKADVEWLAKRVVDEFAENALCEYTKFNYAPFLLVGLLRWRMKSSRGLIAGSDPVADEMVKASEGAIANLRGGQRRSINLERKARRWLPILSQVLDELRGVGGNPNLLADIYSA